MRNEKIGEMLKKYRKLNAFSVSDVVSELNDHYNLQVAEKTVYGWESNQAHPTADTFVILCELYKIHNLSEAMGSTPPRSKDFRISADELELIKSFRENPQMQPAVKRILHMKNPD